MAKPARPRAVANVVSLVGRPPIAAACFSSMKKNAGAASFKYKRHGMRMVPQRLEKVFETACAAKGTKSLQNRWDVTVCPNIVAQIGQHIKHTWPTIASTGNGDEPPKRTSATRPRAGPARRICRKLSYDLLRPTQHRTRSQPRVRFQ